MIGFLAKFSNAGLLFCFQISGFGRLFAELGKTWLPHILATQVPGVVKGVAPLQPVVNISTGIADLVLLPIEQFHRDGKVVRGLQRGALSFARLAGVELLGAGSALALGTQSEFEANSLDENV